MDGKGVEKGKEVVTNENTTRTSAHHCAIVSHFCKDTPSPRCHCDRVAMVAQ